MEMLGKRFYFAALCLVFVLSFPGFAQTLELNFPPQAIIIASYRGDAKLLMEILDSGVDMYARYATGATVLHTAIYQSNLGVVKLLLDYGFDPNVKDNNGHTPLYISVVANNLGAARLLINYGANKYARDVNGITPMDKARKDEKSAMISLLSRS
jgi:ankyrin repeat protein